MLEAAHKNPTMKYTQEHNTPGQYAGSFALRQGVLRKPGRNAPRRPPLCKRRVRCWNCRGSSLHMGRAAVIWPESCLSHREGANVSDFKNVSRCSKVQVKIEWAAPAARPPRAPFENSPLPPRAARASADCPLARSWPFSSPLLACSAALRRPRNLLQRGAESYPHLFYAAGLASFRGFLRLLVGTARVGKRQSTCGAELL